MPDASIQRCRLKSRSPPLRNEQQAAPPNDTNQICWVRLFPSSLERSPPSHTSGTQSDAWQVIWLPRKMPSECMHATSSPHFQAASMCLQNTVSSAKHPPPKGCNVVITTWTHTHHLCHNACSPAVELLPLPFRQVPRLAEPEYRGKNSCDRQLNASD